MSSIYRTNNANRGSPRPAGRGRGVPGRPRPVNAMGHKFGGPGGPAQPLPPITSQDFPLMSSSKVESHNIMNFKTVKPVKLENFTPPVKLQRKDPNAPPPAPANDPGAGPEAMNEEPSRGPKTGADTTLIAPMGGATRNKQMLFKKRTRQIFLAKEDTRKLREQEQKPWVLEDFDNQNSFVGSLEGGQQSDYMLFVFAVRCPCLQQTYVANILLCTQAKTIHYRKMGSKSCLWTSGTNSTQRSVIKSCL